MYAIVSDGVMRGAKEHNKAFSFAHVTVAPGKVHVMFMKWVASSADITNAFCLNDAIHVFHL